MFYVAVPGTRSDYQLVEAPPAREPGQRWAGYVFTATPEVVVHSKMYGSHEKAQPYVLRGVTKGGRLLVQTLIATEYDPIGRWHEVECGDTVEGYRFKRYALKPMMTLLKLATTAAKTRASAEKKQAQIDSRAEKCGMCPVCFADYVVTGKDEMVHHGYRRPGIGYIVGDCHGVGFAPFEVSCEGTKSWVGVLQTALAHREDFLATIDARDEITVVSGTKRVARGMVVPEHKTLKRGEPGFDRAIAAKKAELQHDIRSINHDLVEYGKKIAAWKPQQWPRATRKSRKAS